MPTAEQRRGTLETRAQRPAHRIGDPVRAAQPRPGELGSTPRRAGRAPAAAAATGTTSDGEHAGSRRPGSGPASEGDERPTARARGIPGRPGAEGEREGTVERVARRGGRCGPRRRSRAARTAAHAPMATARARKSRGTTVTVRPAERQVGAACPAATGWRRRPASVVHDTVLSEAATHTSRAGRTNDAWPSAAAAPAPATGPPGQRRPGPARRRRSTFPRAAAPSQSCRPIVADQPAPATASNAERPREKCPNAPQPNPAPSASAAV